MIRDYADHAANERTFLAWLRTGMAVVAFEFVIEKFNLFVLTLADARLSSMRPLDAHSSSMPGVVRAAACFSSSLRPTIRSCA